MKRTLTLVALLALLPACGGRATVTVDDAVRREKEGGNSDTGERRLNARTAAEDYLRQRMPDSQVKGMALTFHPPNVYVVAVDADRGGEGQTLYLMARPYVNAQGGEHWKVEEATPEKLTLATRDAE